MPTITADYDTKLGVLDKHIGTRLRERRDHLGIPLDRLGAAMGIDRQTIQKYEVGDVRITASRLYLLSQFLEVPINYFFEKSKFTPAAKLPNTADLIVDALSSPPAQGSMSLTEIIALISKKHAALGVSAKTIREVASRMSRDGRLVRLAGNGVYALPSQVH